MRDYVILTDSCCDLTAEEITELGLTVLPLTYTLDGVNHKNDVFHPEMTNQEFFQKIREGADCSTSAVSVGEFHPGEREGHPLCQLLLRPLHHLSVRLHRGGGPAAGVPGG